VTGGSLTAAGADGTQFTLEVPAGALLEETHIYEVGTFKLYHKPQ